MSFKGRIYIMTKQPVRASLSDFIKSNMGSQFVIPVYQRNYSWNPEKETKAFMDDMCEIVKYPSKRHFIGIVIYKGMDVTAMFKQLQIVDGQQRLTTAFIFLLALRRAAKEKGETELASVIDEYYIFNKMTPEAGKVRLKTASSGEDVLTKLIYGVDCSLSPMEKDSYVYRNYSYIMERIYQLAERFPLCDVLGAMTRMDVLEFPLEDDDNVQQIFETINATGAPLTAADLIRNYVLMNQPQDVQERYYSMYWKTLEEIFPQPQRLEEFFRNYIAIKTYALTGKKDVYHAFKDYWSRRVDSAETKLKELNVYASAYRMLYEGPCEDAVVEEALVGFRAAGSRVSVVFLMETARMYMFHEISGKSFAKIVKLIDSYITRRSLCGMDNTVLIGSFPIILRSVLRTMQRGMKDIYEVTVMNLVTNNRGKAYAMPTDDQLRSRLREVNAYALPIVRPVLDRLEHDGSNAKVDTSGLNIEHIMPQHANAYWEKHSGTKGADEYALYANLIGNLTLCARVDNTKMGNEDFAFKKKILAATNHIRMNTSILQMDEWNKDTILARCSKLTEAIIRLYPFPYETAAEVGMEDDVLVLISPTANAKAIVCGDGSVEVLSGTRLKPYGEGDMKKMKVLYNDYTARGLIRELEDGQAVFENAIKFVDLNQAAQFLLHRGGDNMSAWSYEDGRPVVVEVIKKKPEVQPKVEPKKKVEVKKEPQPKVEPKKKVEVKREPQPKAEPKKKVEVKKEPQPKAEPKKKAEVKKKQEGQPKKKQLNKNQASKKVQGNPNKKTKHANQDMKKPSRKQEGNKAKKNKKKDRGFAPQASHSKSERQVVNIIRFAGQG